MENRHWLMVSAVFVVVFAVAVSGCSKPAGSTSEDANAVIAADKGQLDGPVAAVHEFLEALRTGNDAKASSMLSVKAREKTASLNRSVTPPASDTASFAIGEVDYVNDDGARVACQWTDLDADGQPRTDQAVWILRREPSGWCIVGVAAQVFPGEEPLVLNFEDPDDMFRKQQWVRDEIRRRMEADALQAHETENQEKPYRR